LIYSLKVLISTLFQSNGFAMWLWKYAPVIETRNINSPENWGFFLLIICSVIGRVIWDSATRLSQRIGKIVLKVEENAWERELMSQQGQVVAARTDILEINIELQQKDEWYGRPIGIILLAVAATVLGQWCNLTFGLAKL
jgi:hypothetical protein